MKSYYLIALLAIFFTIGSCSDDDRPIMDPQGGDPNMGNPDTGDETPDTGGETQKDSIVFFTINTNENLINDRIKSYYIIINDTEGKLVDFKKLENNVLSNDRGFQEFNSSDTSSSVEYTGIKMKENSKFMFTVHFKSKPSKYIILENLKDTEVNVVNGDQMMPFDNQIAINVPKDGRTYTKSLTAQYNNSETFSSVLFSDIVSGESDNFNLLDAFSNYGIVINYSEATNNFKYDYLQITSSPKDITIENVDFNITIINTSIDKFELQTQENHDRRLTEWEEVIKIDRNTFTKKWSFVSDVRPYTARPELPEELLTEFPDFKVENLEYKEIEFRVGGNSYVSAFENPNSSTEEESVVERFVFENPDPSPKSFEDEKTDVLLKKMSFQ